MSRGGVFARDILQETPERGGILEYEIFFLRVDMLEHLEVHHFDLDG